MLQRITLKDMRDELIGEIGPTAFAQIHRQNAALDFAAVVGAPLLFWASFALLFFVHSLPLALALAVTQAVLVNLMVLVNHDVFVHRRRGGSTLAWIAGMILCMPMLVSVSRYKHTHLQHHGHVGTPQDSERYKQDLTTRTRRLLFCTFYGAVLAVRGRMSANAQDQYFDIRTPDARQARRLVVERWVYRVFLVAMLGSAVFDWWPALFGYGLPILVLVPTLNTLRIIIEHADLDPDNPRHLATYYKTGWLTRAVFLWDSGDCHLVHHLFPNVPYYRVGAALRLMEPKFAQWDIAPRHSYWALVKGWFVDAYPHRTLWPI